MRDSSTSKPLSGTGPPMVVMGEALPGWIILLVGPPLLWQAARKHGYRGQLFGVAIGLPLLMAGVFWLFLIVKQATQWSWSASRLAPAMGLLKGFNLYSAPTRGPINGWLYGPVPALLWLPAGFCHSELAAIETAETLNVVIFVLPLFMVGLLASGPSLREKVIALWCAAGATACLVVFYSTWYSTVVLTADAAAVAFGVLGCAALNHARPTARRLALAAALTAVGVWSKQILLPLVLAQLLWLGWTGGRSLVWRYGGWIAGFGLGLGLVFAAAFGLGNLYYNMWAVPSTHALVGGWRAAAGRIATFLAETAPLLLLIVAAWRRPPDGTARGVPPLLLIAAAVLLPFGIATSLKVGADENSIHSYYFMIAAAIPAAIALVRQNPRQGIAWMMAAVGATVGVAASVEAVRAKDSTGPNWGSNEASYEFARSHPGQVYFPWDPLATLMADGKVYHFEYGVRDRLLAGVRPGLEQMKDGLPPNLSLVVYPAPVSTGFMVEAIALLQPKRGLTMAGSWSLFHFDHYVVVPTPAAKP